MDSFHFQGFNTKKLANAVIFVNDVIPGSQVFVTAQNLRVFKAGSETGVHRPMAEKLIGRQLSDFQRRDLEALGNRGFRDAEIPFRKLEALKLFVSQRGVFQKGKDR